LAQQYRGEAFVTGALIRLGLDTGVLEWSNAGHPAPLLLRDRRVVRELQCAPSWPLGLSGECRQVATEALEPGDTVLFFTDGMVEGRSPDGEEYGVDRLSRAWELQSASGQLPDEILRRLVEAVIEFNNGKLRDDATLLELFWSGPATLA
jgi:serine phosphatase RsbU (regulator of sigma subunit)